MTPNPFDPRLPPCPYSDGTASHMLWMRAAEADQEALAADRHADLLSEQVAHARGLAGKRRATAQVCRAAIERLEGQPK